MTSERVDKEQKVTEASGRERETRGEQSDQQSYRGQASGTSMTIANLSAYYADFHAVDSVDMKVEPNKVTALIGPSGCGKSTYLRCLNRMHEVIPEARAEGCVKLGEQDIYDGNTDPVKIRRRVGMVFQAPEPLLQNYLRQYNLGSQDQRLQGRHGRARGALV